MNEVTWSYVLAIAAAVLAVGVAWILERFAAGRRGDTRTDERTREIERLSAATAVRMISFVAVGLWLWDALGVRKGDIWASPLTPLVIVLVIGHYLIQVYYVWRLGGGDLGGVDYRVNGAMTVAAVALLLVGPHLGAWGMFIGAVVILAVYVMAVLLRPAKP